MQAASPAWTVPPEATSRQGLLPASAPACAARGPEKRPSTAKVQDGPIPTGRSPLNGRKSSILDRRRHYSFPRDWKLALMP